jgi:hypothetical protein
VHHVLRHRVGITYEAEAGITSVDIINKINNVEVPKVCLMFKVQVLE